MYLQLQVQNKKSTRTIRVFSKLATAGAPKPSLIQRKKSNESQSSSSMNLAQKNIPPSSTTTHGGPSKPQTVQRKTSKGSLTSSQRKAAMHSEDIVWKWKMMRERKREENRMAEF